MFLFCVLLQRKIKFESRKEQWNTDNMLHYVHTTGYCTEIMHFILSYWNTIYILSIVERRKNEMKLKTTENEPKIKIKIIVSGGAPQQSIKGQPILQMPMRCRPYFLLEPVWSHFFSYIYQPQTTTVFDEEGYLGTLELVITLGYEQQFQRTRLRYYTRMAYTYTRSKSDLSVNLMRFFSLKITRLNFQFTRKYDCVVGLMWRSLSHFLIHYYNCWFSGFLK